MKLLKFLCSKLIGTFSVKEKNAVKIQKAPFSSKIKPLYILNKNDNWHCQKQKALRILLAFDFVTWTARYRLDLVFVSVIQIISLCYLLLMLITFHNFIIYLILKLSQIRIRLYFLNRCYHLTLLQFRNQVDTSTLVVWIILKF